MAERRVVDSFELSKPIIFREEEITTVDVYAPTIGDLCVVDVSPFLTFAEDADGEVQIEGAMQALYKHAGAFRDLLARVTPLSKKHVESMAAADLMAAYGVVLPLLLSSPA